MKNFFKVISIFVFVSLFNVDNAEANNINDYLYESGDYFASKVNNITYSYSRSCIKGCRCGSACISCKRKCHIR
jgi:hypothetical protein